MKFLQFNGVLIIRIRGDLLKQSLIGITVLFLDHMRSQRHAKESGGHARFAWEQIGIFSFIGTLENGN